MINQYFNDGYKKLPAIDKMNYRQLINLSSNESQHEAYSHLFADFIKNYDPSIVTRYPVFREAHNEASKYHDMPSSHLMLTPGSDFAINLIINAIGVNMQCLVTHTPNYIGYTHYASLQNMSVIQLKDIDLNKIEDHKEALIAITNPDGFLGRTLPLSVISDIAHICHNNNNILIVDEAYIEFNPFEHKDLVHTHDNLIIIRSYSKGLGLASMRLGAIISNKNVIEYLTRFASENCISDISLSYLMYLMRQKNKLRAINQDICNLRDNISHRISQLMKEWSVYKTNSNFLTIATRSEKEALSIQKSLIRKNIRIRVILEDERYKHCLRITVPTINTIDLLLNTLTQHYRSSIYQ